MIEEKRRELAGADVVEDDRIRELRDADAGNRR